jgi:hypothetical protein
MSQETFCLKWKTYGAHLTTVFTDLFNQNIFSDVTLVSDDQTQLPAHKIVLSACSPVLGNILLSNPHSHPLIYLRGVKQQDTPGYKDDRFIEIENGKQDCKCKCL